MNRKTIIILGTLIILGVIGIIVVYILLPNNESSLSKNTALKNQEEAEVESINISNKTDSVDSLLDQNITTGIPISVLSKLNINQKTKNIFWYYSPRSQIAFTYEPSNIIDGSDVKVGEDLERIYIYIPLQNKESGQSIEVININETLRFRDIPSIIREQILIADEKQGCSIEENNGRYTIKPKTNTKTCGNYADINNKFFVKPIEDSGAISKLIFVNAGSQELSYDGNMKGKYWYESVIVE